MDSNRQDGSRNVKYLLATCYFGLCVIGIAISTIGPSLPPIMKDLRLDLGAGGVLLSLRALGRLLASPVGGTMSDRWGRRPVIVVGAFVMAVGLLASSINPSWLSLSIWSFVTGLGIGQVDGGINALVTDLSSKKRGFGLNMLHVFFGVGALLGPLGAGLLLNKWGDWRLVLGISGITCLLFSCLFLFQKFPDQSGAKHSEPVKPRIPKGIFRDTLIVCLGMVMFIYQGAGMGITGWVNSYLADVMMFTALASSSVLSLYNVGLTLGRVVCSFVSDRLGFARLLSICCIGSFISMGIAVFGGNASLTVAGFWMTGFFFSGLFPTSIAYATSKYPKNAGAVSGLLITASSLGGIAVPWVMGIVADSSSLVVSMRLSWSLLAVMALLGISFIGRARSESLRARGQRASLN